MNINVVCFILCICIIISYYCNTHSPAAFMVLHSRHVCHLSLHRDRSDANFQTHDPSEVVGNELERISINDVRLLPSAEGAPQQSSTLVH